MTYRFLRWIGTGEAKPREGQEIVFLERGSIYPKVGRYSVEADQFYVWTTDEPIRHELVDNPVDYWFPLPAETPDGRQIWTEWE